MELKVTQIGNSLGVILPKEALARLKVEKGEKLFMVETRDGYQLVPYSPELAEQMAIGREVMKKYRDTLRALAK